MSVSFYSIAADIVVLTHFLWIIFLIFGAVWGRKYRPVKIFHLFGMGFAVVIQIFGWYCPLTHLEIRFRRMHNPEMTYSGSFIIHYIEKLVYVNISARTIFILTIVLAIITAWIYLKKPWKKAKI
ncbi:MAG: DUF2784 domain-containing protein [Nitrospirae bacterium]|nr:DUF2784 domain-containing protein [Nitrospirota bacterium]